MSDVDLNMKLPRRVVVDEVLQGRYSPGERPLSWDARREGIEVIRTADNEEMTLLSSGQQSTPAPGWELLLMQSATDGSTQFQALGKATAVAYKWTLYGIQASRIAF